MSDALLDVQGICVSFGGLRALTEVSLHVPQGSIVGLIGPNGAGKTTLFNVISGFQRADAGIVRFEGRDITRLASHRRSALGIGRSFQNLGLIGEETVGVNIMAAEHLAAGYTVVDMGLRPWRWWREERRLRSRALHVATAFGLSELWEERIDDLSFGRARFVELACIQAEQPSLMLLDEPTTGLDARETTQLLQVLRERREMGTTILLVAHDVRFVMDICDHVYVLTEGRVLFEGAPHAVQRHPGVIEAYLGRSA